MKDWIDGASGVKASHWTAFVIACRVAAFLGSYTYDACLRICYVLEHVTIPAAIPDYPLDS
jgi:hypothetical protein